jgi:hypothetical protein
MSLTAIESKSPWNWTEEDGDPTLYQTDDPPNIRVSHCMEPSGEPDFYVVYTPGMSIESEMGTMTIECHRYIRVGRYEEIGQASVALALHVVNHFKASLGDIKDKASRFLGGHRFNRPIHALTIHSGVPSHITQSDHD